MTSVALHAVSRPLAATNSLPPTVVSPSNRPYSSPDPLPIPEAYHAEPEHLSTSLLPSQRHPQTQVRKPIHLDIHSHPGHNHPARPTATAGTPAEHHTSATDRRTTMPTAVPAAVPVRSSSNYHTGAAPGSRRAVYASERASSSSRRTHPDARGDPEDGAAAPASRSRRSSQYQAAQDPQRRPGSTREGQAAGTSMATSARQQGPAAHTSSKGPSRETSEILSSVLVSQPEVDIERERERLAMAQPHHVADPLDDESVPPPVVSPASNGEEPRRGGRSRRDYSKREKHTKFGEYILGNTIGEGEFGKVKLGWKQEGGVQVAIKLMKKDQLGNNPSRMAKIMREVAILKQLTHPNIVRLHKMEESERHYGIILEYASGGELFDYILNHRYLKDNAARRLFAQLISGVGYLHKKGIVHRDLKLENLLLDRNRNIIITDFGFANTFDSNEELTEEEEINLSDREFVKRAGLDKVKPNGSRKGDLMQTSCGSPCYAAPELVVSDSLYTGRKVDVWSCGVILYAMLAGYLPFDDDPANPEGDNINLLYKYIVNTPLTFPEYVTPHARDLLRRILVPNPRKRADLFEVARHSWLSDYAHVVELITSSTTTPSEIQNTTVAPEDESETHTLARSASVRESSKKAAASPGVGGLVSKQGTVDTDADSAHFRQQKDAKRRTVQVEYVAPTTQTQRGETGQPSAGKTRARSGSQGPVEVAGSGPLYPQDQPPPRSSQGTRETHSRVPVSSRRPPSSHREITGASTRANRDSSRMTADNAYLSSTSGATGARPTTGGSARSTGSRGLGAGGRATYGQPSPPVIADTNVHGRIQQPPRTAGSYVPGEQQDVEYGRPSVGVPPKFARVSGFPGEGKGGDAKGHKRSNTIGEIGGKIFGRSGSIFGGKTKRRPDSQHAGEKSKKYPPVSMNNSLSGADEPRRSLESKRSRRSFSVGLGKKKSGSVAGSQTSQEKHSRRFSLIPGFSFKAIGLGKDHDATPTDSLQDLPIQEPPAADEDGVSADQTTAPQQVEASMVDGMYAQLQDPVPAEYKPAPQHRFGTQHYVGRPSASQIPVPSAALHNGSGSSSTDNFRRVPGPAPHPQQQRPRQQESNGGRKIPNSSRANRGMLQRNKRFVDAWDTDESSRARDHSGSSGPARKVMDFFRRRGKARGGEDR